MYLGFDFVTIRFDFGYILSIYLIIYLFIYLFILTYITMYHALNLLCGFEVN